jgi:glycosyltransferase 2 family protein
VENQWHLGTDVTDLDPPVDSPVDSSGPRRPARSQAVVTWTLVVVLFAGMAYAVGGRWGEVRATLTTVSGPMVLTAGLLIVVALLGPWRAWDAVVAEGRALPWRTSAEIFYVGQLGKYLPGAVWPVLVQMRLGGQAGLTRTRIALSFVTTLLQGMATGVLVGLLAAPWLIARSPHWAWGLLLAPVAALALWPRGLDSLTQHALRLARRPRTDDFAPSGRAVRRAVAAYCFFWLVGGLHLYLLVVDLGGDPLTSLPLSVGALGLAMGLGPVFVVLPAGAGVREAVLVATLTTVLSVPEAVAVALVSRALVMFGDAVLGLAAFLAAREAS